MKILAFDASSIACSAAVAIDGEIISSVFLNNGLTHSQTLLCVIKGCLEKSSIDISELDKIAVVVGPGSFTGVKIAVATAKGLAFPYNTPCIAVSSLEALAYNAKNFSGLVCPIMDARRNQFYNALFKIENGVVSRLCPDRQIEKAELITEIDSNTLLVGDGIKLFNNELYRFAPMNMKYINSESILTLVNDGNGLKINHENLAPIYLRLSQAERERINKEEAKKC